MKLSSIPPPVWYSLAALLAGYFLWRQGGKAAAALGKAVSPVNHDNIFAASVNAAGDALDGGADDSFSLGASLFNLFKDDEFEQSEAAHRAALGKKG